MNTEDKSHFNHRSIVDDENDSTCIDAPHIDATAIKHNPSAKQSHIVKWRD